MHEVGLVEDMVRAILKKTEAEGLRIEKVFVRLGPMTELGEETFRFWFDTLSKGTRLEGAVLEISPAADRGIFVDSVEVEDKGRR